MSAQTLLSGGDKYYSYSGEVFGDVSAPATISMILLPNTGLRDSLIQVNAFFGKDVSTSNGQQLGLQIKLDDVIILNEQPARSSEIYTVSNNMYSLFIPRQSKVEIISLNTSGNNTQIRGVNLIGYYL
tara:strand:+ start:56 stop:439 length:384 start_codon:yes stop_codon:yes gene_type:complete